MMLKIQLWSHIIKYINIENIFVIFHIILYFWTSNCSLESYVIIFHQIRDHSPIWVVHIFLEYRAAHKWPSFRPYKPCLQILSDPGSNVDLFLWPSVTASLKKPHHITPAQIEVALTHYTHPHTSDPADASNRVCRWRGKGVVYPKRNRPVLISSVLKDSDTVTISHSQPVWICGSFRFCSRLHTVDSIT